MIVECLKRDLPGKYDKYDICHTNIQGYDWDLSQEHLVNKLANNLPAIHLFGISRKSF